MPLKIALAGQKGVGKDTVFALIKDLAGEPVGRVAFADALKSEVEDMVWIMYPFLKRSPVHDLLKDRPLMGPAWQWWGEFRRRVDPDYWINRAQDVVNYTLKRGVGVVITDVRHHNECDWANQNGFLTVRIEGPDHREPDGRDMTHPSEIHVPNLRVEHVLQNYGTLDDLRELVRDYLLPAARSDVG